MPPPRRRTRIPLAAAVALLVVVALLGAPRLGGPRRTTQRQLVTTQKGMTLAEVEAICGGPGEPVRFDPDPAAPGDAVLVLGGRRVVRVTAGESADPAVTWLMWRGADGSVTVGPFRGGVLHQKYGFGATEWPGFFEPLRGRLGL